MRREHFEQGAAGQEAPYDSLTLTAPNVVFPNHYSITAKKGASWRGDLIWHKLSGTILSVQVHPEHLRKGIATSMLNEAHRQALLSPDVPHPVHSDALTEAGEAWAKSTGK